MNEEQIAVLEAWIKAERASARMVAARMAGATEQEKQAALAAFQKACNCARAAFNMIRAVYGPLV